MGFIYVAGPVFPGVPGRLEGELPGFYNFLKSEIESLGGGEAIVPKRDHELSRMPAEDFYRAIFQRIKESSGMVTVLVEGDQSAPAEAALGAVNLTRQLLVAEFPERVPRILRGLPFIVGVANLRALTEIRSGLAQLLKLPPQFRL